MQQYDHSPKGPHRSSDSTRLQGPEANGNIVPVRNQVQLRFSIEDKEFEETFLILPTMRTILIGMSIFKQYSVTLEIRKQVIHFPERPLQLRNGKYNGDMCELRVAQKIVLPPNKQNALARCTKPEIGTTTGTAEASKTITRKKRFYSPPF